MENWGTRGQSYLPYTTQSETRKAETVTQTFLLIRHLHFSLLWGVKRWRRSSQLSSRKASLLWLSERPNTTCSWRDEQRQELVLRDHIHFPLPGVFLPATPVSFCLSTLGGCELPSCSLLGHGVTVFTPLPGAGLPNLTISDGWQTGVSLVYWIPC